MSKNITLKVTRAFVYGAKIRVPGTKVSMSEAEAKPLLEAGKAVILSGAAEEVPAAEEAPAAEKVPAGKKAK